MNFTLQSLRPVGNPIRLHKEPLDYTHFDNAHVEFYQSGTAALAAALITAKNVRSEPGASCEVLLPAYACPDLISACHYAGVKPVLIELEPDSCWMSLNHIESVISEQTVAIIAVRFLGIAERMEKLRSICTKQHLLLIEDSAQGFPTSNPGAYWQGDMTILSFGRGKPVNLLGGGALLTKNDDCKRQLPVPGAGQDGTLDSARYLAKVSLYNVLIKPFVYAAATRLPGLNIGETVYKPLHRITGMSSASKARINANINAYNKLPNGAAAIHSALKSTNMPELMDLPMNCQHDFADPLLRYPLLIKEPDKRNTVYGEISKLGASLMYKEPLYRISGIPDNLISRNLKLNNTEAFSRHLITLPTHSDVTAPVVEEIFARIRKILT